MRCVLRYNRDILGKKEISMSFKENNCQQISFTDTFLYVGNIAVRYFRNNDKSSLRSGAHG